MGEPIHPAVGIGHVHLRVSDLRRATDFYHDVLGFDIMMYGPDTIGVGMAFLSAGGYHHHIGLNTFESEGGNRLGARRPLPPCHPLPDRRELAKAVRRVLDHGHALTGSEYDGFGERVYLDDLTAYSLPNWLNSITNRCSQQERSRWLTAVRSCVTQARVVPWAS